MVNNLVEQILKYAEKTSEKKLFNFTAIGISLLFLVSFFLIYQIRSEAENLQLQIKSNLKKALKIQEMAVQTKLMNRQEEKILSILKNNKESLKEILEQEDLESLNPDPNWKESIKANKIPEMQSFQEESVRLSLKDISCQQLVEFLNSLRNKELISVKELEVKNNENNLNASILLTGIKSKN